MTDDLNKPIKLDSGGIKFILRMTLAWFLIVLGVAGIVLPILPGWPFFLTGLALLDVNGTIRKRVWSWFPPKAQNFLIRQYKKIRSRAR